VMKSSAAFLHKREEEREMEIYDGERVLWGIKKEKKGTHDGKWDTMFV
jgi:hypothetical protein